MNTAQKLREKRDKTDTGIEEFCLEDLYDSELRGYLQALDDVEKKMKTMAKPYWQDKHIKQIIKELRG